MRVAFPKSVTTPLPALLIPILLGVTTALGAATGVASVGIQAYQQAQVNKQIEEQEEIARLQKRLTRHQLKQFEEQDKAEKEMNLFKTPMNIGVTTRSMAQGANLQRSISNANLLSNTGLGPILRGNIVESGVPVMRNPMNLTLQSSTESLDLFNRSATPRLISPYGSRQSLFGSTESLDRQHSAFARNLQARYPAIINLSDDMELRQRGPATMQPSAQEHFASPGLYSTPKTSRRETPLPPSSPSKRRAPPPPTALSEGIYEYPTDDILPLQRPSTSFLKTLKSIPRRIRGLFPPHTSNLGENVPLLTGGSGGGRRTSLGRFLNTHKRKLIIGGGILGGAAIVGGTVAGIFKTKREKTMQGHEPRGMFEQLSRGSVGGGGGGGFGRYQQIQTAARGYGAAPRRRVKRSKKGSKKGSQKRSKKAKKGVRHGRVRKGKGKKAVCSINKRGKKVCKKRKTAF